MNFWSFGTFWDLALSSGAEPINMNISAVEVSPSCECFPDTTLSVNCVVTNIGALGVI